MRIAAGRSLKKLMRRCSFRLSRVSRKILYFPLDILFFIVDLVNSTRTQKKDHFNILFVIGTTGGATFLSAFKKCAEEIPGIDIKFFVAIHPHPKWKVFPEEIVSILSSPLLSFFKSRIKKWDLIVTMHNDLSVYSKSSKIVFMYHSIGNIKKNGTRYSYLYPADKNGEPIYDSYLVQSNNDIKHAKIHCPKLNQSKDRMVVIGDLILDDLLYYAHSREEMKSYLGFSDIGKKLLVVMSTWGQESLFDRSTETFYDRLEELKVDYNIYLSLHPMIHMSKDPLQVNLLAALRDRESEYFRVGRPEDNWMHAVAAGDFALSDHTSMSLYFAFLERPVAYLPIVDESYVDVSDPFYRFLSLCPQLDTEAPFGDQIDAAAKNFDYKATAEVLNELVDYVGNSKEMLRKVLGERYQIRASAEV